MSIALTFRRFRSTNIRFFTKENCMLCYKAKETLKNALNEVKVPYSVQYVDIEKNENADWFDLYCYDIPVIHVEHDDKTIRFKHKLFKDKVIESLK